MRVFASVSTQAAVQARGVQSLRIAQYSLCVNAPHEGGDALANPYWRGLVAFPQAVHAAMCAALFRYSRELDRLGAWYDVPNFTTG